MYPSVRFIILDPVFNKIGDRKCDLDLIDLGSHRPETLKHQIHMLLLRDRTQPL